MGETIAQLLDHGERPQLVPKRLFDRAVDGLAHDQFKTQALANVLDGGVVLIASPTLTDVERCDGQRRDQVIA